MELAVTLLCIGTILAVLAAGAWKLRPQNHPIDPELVERLREAVVDPVHEAVLRERIPPGAHVLQLGGIGMGHLAAAWDAVALGDVTYAKREHPDTDFRPLNPSNPTLFLPESFTHVVIREFDDVQHKDVWLQNAYRWLDKDGMLFMDSPQRASKGGVTWESRDVEGIRTETVRFRGKTARRSRPVYVESRTTLLDMIASAGFVPADGGFRKVHLEK